MFVICIYIQFLFIECFVKDILFFRKDNSDLKGKLQSQDDMILGLRRDLAGAHARLSDITGIQSIYDRILDFDYLSTICL